MQEGVCVSKGGLRRGETGFSCASVCECFRDGASVSYCFRGGQGVVYVILLGYGDLGVSEGRG